MTVLETGGAGKPVTSAGTGGVGGVEGRMLWPRSSGAFEDVGVEVGRVGTPIDGALRPGACGRITGGGGIIAAPPLTPLTIGSFEGVVVMVAPVGAGALGAAAGAGFGL